MRRIRERKCKNCNDYFLPDYRNRNQQEFCTKPLCRKASKANSQRRWLKKPENKDYFQGAPNVERVRQWRKSHPGYWSKMPDRKNAIQDLLSAETVDNSSVAGYLIPNALQDLLSAQPLVLLGLIAKLTGSALQDDIATTARYLRQLGEDILIHKFQGK